MPAAPTPPPTQLANVNALIADASLTCTCDMPLKDLLDLNDEGRPAVLAGLKKVGVDKLGDRQKLAGAVAKAVREGRFELAAKAGYVAPPKSGFVPASKAVA